MHTWLSKCLKLDTITTSGGHLTCCVLSVLLETMHEFAIDHHHGTIASRGAINAQISIVISQTGTERSRQEQEVVNSDCPL